MKSNNYYSTDKKHSKLISNLATRLAHNTLGKEKSKYIVSCDDFCCLHVVSLLRLSLCLSVCPSVFRGARHVA